MAISTQQHRQWQQPYRGGRGYVARSTSSGLYDVLELILDKGLVIDVFVRVSLIGTETSGLPELMEDITSGGAEDKTKGVLKGAKEALFGDEDEDKDKEK